MALARGRRERGVDYWPGFVDALSTLILGIIFLITVFAVVQFFLSQEVTGKDTALSRLAAQIAQLREMLSLEQTGKLSLEDQIAQRHFAGPHHGTLDATRSREGYFAARAGAGRGA
jgi:chemotaxis protein MotB